MYIPASGPSTEEAVYALCFSFPITALWAPTFLGVSVVDAVWIVAFFNTPANGKESKSAPLIASREGKISQLSSNMTCNNYDES